MEEKGKRKRAPKKMSGDSDDSDIPLSLSKVGPAGCRVCGKDENDFAILLCDGCDGEYHMYCLKPPIQSVPNGEFFCPKCTKGSKKTDYKIIKKRIKKKRKTDAEEKVTSSKGGYRGVSYRINQKAWAAQITMGGVRRCIGFYDSEYEAAIAYDKAAVAAQGSRARLNFPQLLETYNKKAADKNSENNSVSIDAMKASVKKLKGVDVVCNKYSAKIFHDGRTVYLGAFDSAESAAWTYDEAAKKYFGDSAVLNYPNGTTKKVPIKTLSKQDSAAARRQRKAIKDVQHWLNRFNQSMKLHKTSQRFEEVANIESLESGPQIKKEIEEPKEAVSIVGTSVTHLIKELELYVERMFKPSCISPVTKGCDFNQLNTIERHISFCAAVSDLSDVSFQDLSEFREAVDTVIELRSMLKVSVENDKERVSEFFAKEEQVQDVKKEVEIDSATNTSISDPPIATPESQIHIKTEPEESKEERPIENEDKTTSDETKKNEENIEKSKSIPLKDEAMDANCAEQNKNNEEIVPESSDTMDTTDDVNNNAKESSTWSYIVFEELYKKPIKKSERKNDCETETSSPKDMNQRDSEMKDVNEDSCTTNKEDSIGNEVKMPENVDAEDIEGSKRDLAQNSAEEENQETRKMTEGFDATKGDYESSNPKESGKGISNDENTVNQDRDNSKNKTNDCSLTEDKSENEETSTSESKNMIASVENTVEKSDLDGSSKDKEGDVVMEDMNVSINKTDRESEDLDVKESSMEVIEEKHTKESMKSSNDDENTAKQDKDNSEIMANDCSSTEEKSENEKTRDSESESMITSVENAKEKPDLDGSSKDKEGDILMEDANASNNETGTVETNDRKTDKKELSDDKSGTNEVSEHSPTSLNPVASDRVTEACDIEDELEGKLVKRYGIVEIIPGVSQCNVWRLADHTLTTCTLEEAEKNIISEEEAALMKFDGLPVENIDNCNSNKSYSQLFQHYHDQEVELLSKIEYTKLELEEKKMAVSDANSNFRNLEKQIVPTLQKLDRDLESTEKVFKFAESDEEFLGLIDKFMKPVLDKLAVQCKNAVVKCLDELNQRAAEYKAEFDYYVNAVKHLNESLVMKESSDLMKVYVDFYKEELQSLWVERRASLEVVRLLERSTSSQQSYQQEDTSDDPDLKKRISDSVEKWEQVKWPEFINEMCELKPQPRTEILEIKQEIKELSTDHEPTEENLSTIVLYHPGCINHQTPKGHPECPERLKKAIGILNNLVNRFPKKLRVERLSQPASEIAPSDPTLRMVHSPSYLQHLRERSDQAAMTDGAPLVFESHQERGTSTVDSIIPASDAVELPKGAMDTYVCGVSWEVALIAAGTVCLAVDRVMQGQCVNAVCLVRPPGHHVGRDGRTNNAPSSGFCLLNNVVIGAMHARQYPSIRKVAVLDWDIHHGNGTEELMRGDKDAFFASVHLYSGNFFPGTGSEYQSSNIVNCALKNEGPGSGSRAFRAALENKIFPAMEAFQPDIIFISAGFDGHKDDIIGGTIAVKNKTVPSGYIEEDYGWATKQILRIAAKFSNCRVISVLEGGYDVRRETNSLAKCVASHIEAIVTDSHSSSIFKKET